MLESMFAPAHSLISPDNVNDTPVSHINNKSGKTLPLSTAAPASIPSFDGLFSRKQTTDLNIINEQIKYDPEVEAETIVTFLTLYST